ncbi:hypothetical protein [Tumebacillus flagellatus]|uniref:Uncharacterized protein n=1 Tax=Tumebacillus flagellatus TaxID=1157490 RepID=A0A074LHK7_9BACL|nr:hypothetical protein [Tumebacillus flagellatus]KEO81706.1 hypothetical protein EL26_19005 [Tumebacillus flagellatus]
MERKDGTFAVYRGKEYELSMDAYTGERLLVSPNADSQQEGFVPWEELPGFYKKVVKKEELDSAYRYDNYAVYGGKSFLVENIKEKVAYLIHIGLEGSEEAEALGFKFVDRWEFVKDVPVDKIDEFHTIVNPLWGFELPPGMPEIIR